MYHALFAALILGAYGLASAQSVGNSNSNSNASAVSN